MCQLKHTQTKHPHFFSSVNALWSCFVCILLRVHIWYTFHVRSYRKHHHLFLSLTSRIYSQCMWCFVFEWQKVIGCYVNISQVKRQINTVSVYHANWTHPFTLHSVEIFVKKFANFHIHLEILLTAALWMALSMQLKVDSDFCIHSGCWFLQWNDLNSINFEHTWIEIYCVSNSDWSKFSHNRFRNLQKLCGKYQIILRIFHIKQVVKS